jgi:hypothetical protein
MRTNLIKVGAILLCTVMLLLTGSKKAIAQQRYPSNATLWDIVNTLRYAIYWPTIRDATAYASAEANRRYPNDQTLSGPRNAFKHACWAAILTRELGDAKARNITNGHESWAGNPPLEKQMDLFNNNVGHNRGVLNQRATWSELANLIQNNVSAGNLRIIKNGQLVPSNR